MDEREAVTRKQRVDKLLQKAGWWPITTYAKGAKYVSGAVREYGTDAGPADYVLYHEGAPLAVVEAKRVGLGPQNVLVQAQRYAKAFNDGTSKFGDYGLPFIYSTNGEQVWFQDLRDQNSRSRQVAGFHTPSALHEMLSMDRQAALGWLNATPIETHMLRAYQREAVESVERALGERRRRMLLAMATGTGKTFVAVQLAYRLLKSGYARRILFLVDRRALAAQAVGAFANFEPEPGLKFDRIYEVYSQRFHREDVSEEYKFDPNVLPPRYLTNPRPEDTFVYVCTIQRMRIYLFGRESMFGQTEGDVEDEDDDANKLDIPINAFDIVIADECHRGYTSTEEGKWRQVLDHFDATKIGLTATPAAHTTSYFEQVLYRYEYERAVAEGFLVDYDSVSIRSDITLNGLFLRPGEQVDKIDVETGARSYEVLEDERVIETGELEEKATAPDRNRKIVAEWGKYARQQEADNRRFPKTIFFAINDLPHRSHADQLVQILRDEFPNKGDSFVAKITGSPTVDRPLQRIREFRNRPLPNVAVTVDMLTTGVDLPRVESLVLLRPVRSRILFTQMLGRGTRRCDEINKTRFTVYDCFAGSLLEYFSGVTDFTQDAPRMEVRTVREIVDDIYRNRDREYNVKLLIRRLRRVEKDITPEGRRQFSAISNGLDVGSFAATLQTRLIENWLETTGILRADGFARFMENYPKASQAFLVSGREDIVTSEYLFKTLDGHVLTRQDYLTSFEKFIKENPSHIDALSILLNRPAQFHTRELYELRRRLEASPEHFTENNLRRAYQNELADIVTMVRHAAGGVPLLPANERVERAMARIMKGRKFTPEQLQWLGYIKDHLVRNLIIEEGDFKLIPFVRHGGLARANQVFSGDLSPLLETLNGAMLE